MNWIETLKFNPSAKLQLFCCHHSGVGASSFYPWIKLIPDFVDLKAIQLPGRETRYGEPLLNTINPVVEGILTEFQIIQDKPFLLFGHSVGALIMYELSKKLQNNNMQLPKALIASGCRAPHLLPHQSMHTLPEKEFIETLAGYNGTPNEVLKNQDLLELLLPILRADFSIGETYRYQESEPLKCDIVVLGGNEDPTVGIERQRGWKMHTAAKFSLHMFPGDHFFVKSALNDLLALINEIATKSLE